MLVNRVQRSRQQPSQLRIPVHMTNLISNMATVDMDLHSDGYNSGSQTIIFHTGSNTGIFQQNYQ